MTFDFCSYVICMVVRFPNGFPLVLKLVALPNPLGKVACNSRRVAKPTKVPFATWIAALSSTNSNF